MITNIVINGSPCVILYLVKEWIILRDIHMTLLSLSDQWARYLGNLTSRRFFCAIDRLSFDEAPANKELGELWFGLWPCQWILNNIQGCVPNIAPNGQYFKQRFIITVVTQHPKNMMVKHRGNSCHITQPLYSEIVGQVVSAPKQRGSGAHLWCHLSS